MIPQVPRETAMIPRLTRAIAMNAVTCKSNRDDTRFDCNKVARKPQGSSVTMLLEPECQCVALIAATVKLGQKLDNQPFKSCFQILKARLILPIMSFFPSWKNDRKLIEKLETFLRASGRCPEPRSLPSARPRDLFRELDPIRKGSSAPTTPPLDKVHCAFCPRARKFLLTDDHRQQTELSAPEWNDTRT